MEKAQALVAGLPNPRPLVTVEGGAHASNLTHPAEVKAVIREFLASLSRPAPGYPATGSAAPAVLRGSCSRAGRRTSPAARRLPRRHRR